MEAEEKHMLAGAFASGLTNLGLEAYWLHEVQAGRSPGFPYVKVLHNVLPPLDDWIAEAGVPLVLYGLGKGLKKRSFIEAAKGAAVYGISELFGITVFRVITELVAPGWLGQFRMDYPFPTTNVIREFNMAYDFPSTNVIRQAKWADRPSVKESGHSGEYFPFQTDMGM